jgi:DNA-binding IclR family transcriptional regulator
MEHKMDNSTKPSVTVEAILNAAAVLRSFTRDQLELGASDISRKLSIPKTTAHRILVSLDAGGLLTKNRKTGKYTISPTIYILGNLYLSSTDLISVANPVIKTINELINEYVNIGVFERGNVVIVLKENSKGEFKFTRNVGSVVPAYASAGGKAFLSQLSQDELDRLYPQERLPPVTEKTIATKTDLKIELEEVRKTGIAHNKQGGCIGIEALGSLIKDAQGRSIASLSIAVPMFRMNNIYREDLTKLVILACNYISHMLGYQNKLTGINNLQDMRLWWEKIRSR